MIKRFKQTQITELAEILKNEGILYRQQKKIVLKY